MSAVTTMGRALSVHDPDNPFRSALAGASALNLPAKESIKSKRLACARIYHPSFRVRLGRRTADSEPLQDKWVGTMARHKSVALGVTSALVAVVALSSVPAFAQDDPNGADAYSAGVKLGRTLNDPRKCGGGGDAYQGCVDGVEESQFDRDADKALHSDPSRWKSSE